MKETDTKRKASFVEIKEDGKRIQRDCLVDLQNGNIEVGKVKIAGLKVDETIPVVDVKVEYRGQEFSVDKARLENKTNYSIKDSEFGSFTMLSLRPKRDVELREEEISHKWKPKIN